MYIYYVGKEGIYPAFAKANIINKTIHIRSDLPDSVKTFLLKHETFHLEDKSTDWLWREIKANLYGAFKSPFGFLCCLLLSLSFYRLKFYYQSFKKYFKKGEK